jgi:hypothetical protein
MTYRPACDAFFDEYTVYHRLGVGGLVYLCLYFVSASITFYWLWRQRSLEDIQREEFEGQRAKKNYSIFPVFVPVLVYSVFSDILYGLVLLFTTINEDDPNSWLLSALYASGIIFVDFYPLKMVSRPFFYVVFAIQHFMLEGLAIALCQYGCGFGAAKDSMLKALLWAVFTFVCFLIRFGRVDSDLARAAELVWQVSLGVFYYALWLLPRKYLYRRPAALIYSRFWAVFRTFCIVGDIFYDYGVNHHIRDVGNCMEILFFFYLYVVFKPFVVYYTMLNDTVWWQGQRTGKLIKSRAIIAV